MEHKALLDAVTKVIKALEEVRIELEREELVQQETAQMAEPETTTQAAPSQSKEAPSTPAEIVCPNCGTRLEFDLSDLVNAGSDGDEEGDED